MPTAQPPTQSRDQSAGAHGRPVRSPVRPSGDMTSGLASGRRGGSAWPLIAIGLAVLGVVVWIKGIEPNLEPKRFGVVVDGSIYRSGEPTPGGLKSVVERLGIRTVIDLGAHEPGSREELLAQATADALGVERVVLDLEGDATGDPNDYVEALRVILDEQRHPVLVHCAAGSQRTGCLVAMYRQIEQGWSFDDAYGESFEYDHDPDDPNTHVRRMLEDWTWPVEVAVRTGGAVRADDADESDR